MLAVWTATFSRKHYLLLHILDFSRQLYEYFFLTENEIKRTQKIYRPCCLCDFDKLLTGGNLFNEWLYAATILYPKYGKEGDA